MIGYSWSPDSWLDSNCRVSSGSRHLRCWSETVSRSPYRKLWIASISKGRQHTASQLLSHLSDPTMPPKIATIPRFLLPQTGAIWRNQFVRNATTKAKPGKPLVLEKPARFNPPSHGSRISKGPPRYQYAGPQMTEEQKAAQATKKYPSMMPPEGTFMYWFINNKSIHLYITMVRNTNSPCLV